MRQRPVSLTIVGWLLIVFGAWGVIGTFLFSGMEAYREASETSALGPDAVMALNVLGGAITAVSGTGVIKGMNWARLLYVGWSLTGFVIGLLTAPFVSAALIGLLVILVIAFFLFRPEADAWFGKRYLSKE